MEAVEPTLMYLPNKVDNFSWDIPLPVVFGKMFRLKQCVFHKYTCLRQESDDTKKLELIYPDLYRVR